MKEEKKKTGEKKNIKNKKRRERFSWPTSRTFNSFQSKLIYSSLAIQKFKYNICAFQLAFD